MGALDSVFGAQGLPSSPTSQSIQTSGIAPWAQPYVSDYLNRAQQLSTQGPSAAQQQVYSAAQNMQTPSQFQAGANLAQQGGQGLLGTTGTALGYGALGAGYGGLAAGAGQNYQNMATSPAAMSAYMNPYVQQSLAPQLNLLNQQQALAGQGIAAKAVGQGAFGGNRATLAQGLNAQNYDLARQQAIAQGYNTAFQQAQQAQQFGSTLGLQGLQAAMQGAGIGLQGVGAAQQGYQGATQAGAALGNIGAQQGQYGLGQLALQNQIANQQYNLPYQNLQFMQGMMGGLPVATSTTQGYQAPPNYLSQLAGYGLTGLGVYGMGKDMGWWGGKTAAPNVVDAALANSPSTFVNDMGGTEVAGSLGFRKGGKIQRYDTGGDIKLMSTDELQKLTQNPNVTPIEVAYINKQLALRNRMEENPETRQIMGGGLDTIPSGDMFRAAGGGIVAFAGDTNGSLVTTKSSYSTPKPIRPEIKDYQSMLEQQIRDAMADQGSPYSKSQALEEEYMKAMKERQAKRPYETLLGLGSGMLSGESPYAATNIGKAGINALQQMQKAGLEDAADRKLLLQQQVEQEKSADARRTARLNAMQTQLGQMYTREIGLKNAGATAASAAATKASTEYNKNWNNFQTRVQAEKNLLIQDKSKTFDYDQNPYKLDIDAYKNVYFKTPPDIRKQLELEDPVNYGKTVSGETTKPAPAPQGTLSATSPSPVKPIVNADGTVTIPSGPKKGTYQPQPDGTYKLVTK